MPVDTRDELPGHEYRRRQAAVRAGAPACGTKGRDYATCIREPGHGGRWCEGNGFDQYGPMGRHWPNPRHKPER